MPIGTVNSYSDIDMNMGYHPLTKDLRKKTKEDSIKQSVRNLLLTSPGEKLFKISNISDSKDFDILN